MARVDFRRRTVSRRAGLERIRKKDAGGLGRGELSFRRPQGRAAQKTWSSDWALGPPDLVLELPEAYPLSADGRDEHRVFVIPSGLAEGKWVRAVDFRPGNPRVVHHVLAAFDVTGRARTLDKADPRPGYKTFAGYGTLPSGLPFLPSGGLSGWAPGKMPNELPLGVGRYVPAGADILLQVHYHKSGKDESDRSAIGLYFAKKPIEKQLRSGIVMPPRPGLLARPALRIPAGEAQLRDQGKLDRILRRAPALGHPAYALARQGFPLEAILPDGARRTLIRIEDWDFNWQGTYEFEKAVALPKGTRIEMAGPFRQLGREPKKPEQTSSGSALGRADHRRDVHRLPSAHARRRTAQKQAAGTFSGREQEESRAFLERVKCRSGSSRSSG